MGEDSRFGIVPAKRVREAVPRVFFFASYLYDHRDQLAVGGKKVLGLQLPRIKDLGPIIVVWIVSMGVLVVQHDLGTSLMFFAMFVSMLYVATGRTSWIVIGFIAFAAGAFAAANIFSHVGARVDAWLHPFDSAQYNKEYGGSYQLVTGIFGLASGGLMGTGLGQGHPSLTPIANSDYIYAALGEELGLTGLMAILMLYLLIIAAGMITAMKIKDGFGKLLASGLVFTMAFQVFTVVGGITLVIPLTGLTLPYMAAGGSSLIANYMLAALLVVISNSANKPESDIDSDTFQYERRSGAASAPASRAAPAGTSAGWSGLHSGLHLRGSANSWASPVRCSISAQSPPQAMKSSRTETPASGTPGLPGVHRGGRHRAGFDVSWPPAEGSQAHVGSIVVISNSANRYR